MTYRTREDGKEPHLGIYFDGSGNGTFRDNTIEPSKVTEKPRLDWLLLTVLVADLGVWVGLLAWWIWR